MKKISKNKLIKNYIAILIPLFAIEILFKIFLNMAIIDWSTFRIFLGCNILSLIVSLLCSFVKEKVGNIISGIFLFIATVYAIMQAGFENYIGVYVSLGTSSQLGAVREYISDYFSSFNPLFYLMIIPFVLFILYKIFIEKKVFKNYFKEMGSKFNRRFNKKNTLIATTLTLILCLIYYISLTLNFMQNELQLESTYSLFKNPVNPNISVNQFGIEVFGLLDVKTTLIKPENNEVILEENKEEEPTNPEGLTGNERTFDDTAWKKLNENSKSIDYKNLNTYFMNRSVTPKNEYTGRFTDKNLIMIMMESVNEIFINPEYYPTFYKLYTEGWSFTNSYSPRNSCSTGNNEMSGMTSLFSIYRTCTANDYRNNEYFESMFNLFNNKGYKTSSYHDYTEKYYYRSTIHKNMGSGAYYGVTDLSIPYDEAYEEWPSDTLLFERGFEHIDTTSPFMAWFTTVTSHQPYYMDSEMGRAHLDLFSDTNYPITLKRYMSKLKELDLALARLLEILEEKGVLDDTVIVLYGDHYPYGLSNTDINQALSYDVDTYNNIDKTPFVIYNSKLEAQSFNEYTSYMNILPTIANLFDLDYDPRLYVGEDILNPSYKDSYKNHVILADGSWENDDALYNATSGRISYKNDTVYSNEDIVKINKEINNMIKFSNLAIQTNYFKYLKDGLEEYKENKEDININVEN